MRAAPVADPAPLADARTTPRWLRAPVLLLLALQIGWFGIGYRYAFGARQPPILANHPGVVWFANWQMFTTLNTGATLVEAQARYGRRWVAVDLDALFPTRWESGPRYGRADVYANADRLRILAEATCNRLPQRPIAVRFAEVRFQTTLGQPPLPPPPTATRRPLLRWTCGGEIRVPPGVRL